MENNSIITTSIFGDGYNILILLLAVVNMFFLYKAYQHIQLLKKELYILTNVSFEVFELLPVGGSN